MTVGTQVRQALANAKSVQANFETFALQTQDETAKQMYADAAAQIEEVVLGLEQRLEQIQEEEPQYRDY